MCSVLWLLVQGTPFCQGDHGQPQYVVFALLRSCVSVEYCNRNRAVNFPDDLGGSCRLWCRGTPLSLSEICCSFAGSIIEILLWSVFIVLANSSSMLFLDVRSPERLRPWGSGLVIHAALLFLTCIVSVCCLSCTGDLQRWTRLSDCGGSWGGGKSSFHFLTA